MKWPQPSRAGSSMGISKIHDASEVAGALEEACADGVRTGIRLVAARGRLMQQMAPGSMTAVPLPADRLRFEPDTQIFTEGIVDYTLDTGEKRQLHYEKIGQQTALSGPP